MKVIIAGAGEVGSHSAEVLSEAGHSVTVVDLSATRLRRIDEKLDIRALAGHCAHVDALQEAGVARADLFIAATDADEINVLAAALAKMLGAKRTFVRVHHTAHFALRGTPWAQALGIDELICPEHLTSLDIARIIRNPSTIAIEEFGRGQVVMQRVSVQSSVASVGKTLRDLTLPHGARVALIERKGQAFVPTAQSAVDAGDTVTLVGDRKVFDAARKLFNKGKPSRKHVAVMGEGSTAVWLCRALKSRLFSVRLFVESHDRAEDLAAKLDHVTVLAGDPLDAHTFVDEHIGDVDAFVATTDDDERNIMACANAKAQGVATAFAVVYRSTYLHVLPHVGVDEAFSPRSAAVRAFQNLINDDPVRMIATVAEGMADVYEVRPSKRAKVIGSELRNIRLPDQTVVAAIRSGDEACVPGAGTIVAAGDTLLVIGRPDIADELTKLFVHK